MRRPDLPSGSSDEALEAALRDLGRSIAYPDADLALAVRVRVSEHATARPRAGLRRLLPDGRRPVLGRSVALALLAVLLAVSAAVAVGLGLRGLSFVFVSSLPPTDAPSATRAPTGSPAAPGEALRLGELVTLDDARGAVPFAVRVPTLPGLERPDAVYVARAGGGRVELVYRARVDLPAAPGTDVGLLITQFAGRTQIDLVKKLVTPGTRIEEVVIDGDRGYWITGKPHALLTDEGQERYRLVGDVLVWQRGDVVYRIESTLDRDEVVRIARSLR